MDMESANGPNHLWVYSNLPIKKTKTNQAVSNALIDCWSCLVLIPNLTILFQFEFNWIHICVIFGICNNQTFNYKATPATYELWLCFCVTSHLWRLIFFFVVAVIFFKISYLSYLYILKGFRKLVIVFLLSKISLN